jgi:diguanylate cyclase (GGDEF)-like protein
VTVSGGPEVIARSREQGKPNKLNNTLRNVSVPIFFSRLILVFLFALIQRWDLLTISAVGAVLWTLVWFFSASPTHSFPLVMGALEVCVSSFVFLILLGWNSGAYLQLLAIFPFLLISEKYPSGTRIAVVVLLSVLLILAYLFSNTSLISGQGTVDGRNILFIINLSVACVLLIVEAYSFEREKISSQAEMVDANKQLMTLANTDPLTNLVNRRMMMKLLEEQKQRMENDDKPFSLVMIDVDNFKQINDEYGHDAGDFVLVILAEKIRLAVRKDDSICRWGGDEFLLMLVDASLQESEAVAEKIRARVINSPFIYHEVDIPVTITLGISTCDKNSGIGGAIRRADLALYQGKQSGKNCSVWKI